MLITNFAAGELSPTLKGRVDLQQYYAGCGRLCNFDVIPTGGIKRRTGTKRVAMLEDECVLIPYIVDKNTSFIIQLYKNQMKIWDIKTGQYKPTTAIVGYPYTSLSEIKEIQYAQNFDTVVFVHKNYKPFMLKYDLKFKTFSGAVMDFNFYPDINLDDDYDFIMQSDDGKEPDYISTTAGKLKFSYKKMNINTNVLETKYKEYPADTEVIYCIASGKLKYYDKTAAMFLQYGYDPDVDYKLFKEDGKYPGCVTFYNGRLFFASSILDPQKVWASATPDTKGNRYNNFGIYQKYVTVNKVLKDADAHIFTADIKLTDIDKTAGTTKLTNVTQDFSASGTLKNAVTDYYISGTSIPVGTKVKSVTANTITIDAALSITEDVKVEVMTIQLWRDYNTNAAEDYEYKVIAQNITTSDCSFYFEVASSENDCVKWIAANRYLTIGTESSVWCCPSTITALSITAENSGRYGSDELQALCIDQATVFFAQGAYGIREHYFDSQSEAFKTNNIAILSEKMLTESHAIDFDYVNNPYNRLIIVREDGTAVSLLYDKNNGVMAWNRIKHGNGNILNTAVVRGDRQNDIVFFLIEDEDEYYIERLDENDGVYLDSWTIYDNNMTWQYSGATVYNKTTDKTCDADDIPADFISDGDTVYIGYKFESDIISLPVIDNSVGTKKRIVDLQVRFNESYMPVMKVADLPDETFSHVTEFPYSGVQLITYPGISDRDVTFELKTDDVYPVNILSVNAETA